MRLRQRWGRAWAAIPVVIGAALLGGAPAGVATPAPATDYYVSVGDSLSTGYMPQTGDSDQGYVDDLYATLHATDPGLQLVKFGCSGETTTSMINGGTCSYPDGGNQLTAAEDFLRAHRGHVRLVTLDIGANDVDSCASGSSIDLPCVGKGLTTLATNLPSITRALHAAGGNGPVYAGMTVYDPFLAAWLTGSDGQKAAVESVALVDVVNAVEWAGYATAGFRVADVSAAFHTNDFVHTTTLPGVGTVPVNVATICTQTFMCSAHNIHPTPAGYTLIARTLTPVVTR